MNCPHSGKPCITGTHWCEWCKVPAAYGWFMALNKQGKVGWVQRWIRDDDRENILHYHDMLIEAAEKGKAELMKIPSKEEYERNKNNG